MVCVGCVSENFLRVKTMTRLQKSVLAKLAAKMGTTEANALDEALALLAQVVERELAPAANDKADMLAAFADLDRREGSFNFVSLVGLRKLLAWTRCRFDRVLAELRIGYVLSLSGAEGRNGLSAEQRDAGIVENGSLLLFCSRR